MARRLDLDSRTLLDALIRDTRHACADDHKGPANPEGPGAIRRAIASGEPRLPGAQVAAVAAPLLAWVDEQAKDPRAFADFLAGSLDGDTGAFFDLVQALAQRGRPYEPEATDAFEELVSDLYDGFLSAQDRRGVTAKPDSPLPPLVRWGNPADGPYTWPVESLALFGVGTGVVNLPPAYAAGGLAAWASLGHETCGHDVLNGFPELLPALRRAVSQALEGAGVGDRLVEHWMRCFEEAASDVMGVLNLGPTAALADAAFLLGWNQACGFDGLGTVEDAEDEHPIDLLRVQLGASVTRGLRFAGADEWAAAVEWHARRHTPTAALRLGHRSVAFAEGRASAAVFARAMTGTRLKELDNMSLGEIQNWRDADQDLAVHLARGLGAAGPARRGVPAGGGVYAAHVLAGALMAAMEAPQPEPGRMRVVFARFRATLARLNRHNPAWKPGAMLRHRSDIVRRVLTHGPRQRHRR